MASEAAIQLAEARRAHLISPAGYGKTHAIAEAVGIAATTQGRQLILTHTHAGVHALQAKLRKLGVPQGSYSVETIAGWALKYSAAYRKVSGLDIQPTGAQWDDVYPAALACIKVPAIRDVVLNTYGGMFVDEYQDCVWPQHELVLALANLLPCRLLGDPLQAIFEFAGHTVDFDNDLGDFEAIAPLSTPHRWINESNQALAAWIDQARRDILAGRPLALSPPVQRIAPETSALVGHCNTLIGRQESVVVVHKISHQAHNFAKSTGAKYKSMEEMDCAVLMDFARALDRSDYKSQALATAEFAKNMVSNVSNVLNTISGSIRSDSLKPSRYGANQELAQSFQAILEGGGPAALTTTLSRIGSIDGAKTYRRELNREALRMLRAMDTGKYKNFEAAAHEIRERTRRFGRPAERLSSSRILLIKGLEYQHAVVVKADDLSPKELYVAITRGSKSLAIQSNSETVQTTQPSRATPPQTNPNEDARISPQGSLFDDLT